MVLVIHVYNISPLLFISYRNVKMFYNSAVTVNESRQSHQLLKATKYLMLSIIDLYAKNT